MESNINKESESKKTAEHLNGSRRSFKSTRDSITKTLARGFEPNRVLSVIPDFEAPSDTEIAAEISVPEEGGWGWAVVAASFMSIFILDGTFFTFGSIYKDISEDLGTDVSLVALINSVAIALYFITGPLVSALINRYGFRSCAMAGSIIVSSGYFLSYFAGNYIILLITYGIIPGFGGCFIYMSSQLVVGFYFERLRALAMAIAGLGQSLGVMIMSSVNAYLVQLAGWRTTTLIHSGLFGLVYFIGMAYRPLMSLTVIQETNDSRTLTFLPSLSNLSLDQSESQRWVHNALSPEPSVSERLFMAASNANFPTAAAVIEEGDEDNDDVEPGPSSKSGPLYTITARSPQGGISQGHLRPSQKDMRYGNLQNILPPTQKVKWWARCCRWHKHVEESRPMYRDDVFYNGTLAKLPVYQKSLRDTTVGRRTGLEYRMAVSRTVTTVDLAENKGIFTTAVRRILATMMDPKLLGRRSFLMVCTTGFLAHIGLLVPYVFIPDRNKTEGIEQKHCNMFVSVIGFSNAIGRLVAGILVYKLNQPVRIYSIACILAGTGTIASNFSFNLYYQYFCCVMFGISVAHISTLRSLVIVDLYGLDNLTNATGMLLMFQGFGCLISTPLSSVLKKYFGYMVSFIVAGAFIVVGGIIVYRAKRIAAKEIETKIKKFLKNHKQTPSIKNLHPQNRYKMDSK